MSVYRIKKSPIQSIMIETYSQNISEFELKYLLIQNHFVLLKFGLNVQIAVKLDLEVC